jgi:hypothetical protein
MRIKPWQRSQNPTVTRHRWRERGDVHSPFLRSWFQSIGAATGKWRSAGVWSSAGAFSGTCWQPPRGTTSPASTSSRPGCPIKVPSQDHQSRPLTSRRLPRGGFGQFPGRHTLSAPPSRCRKEPPSLYAHLRGRSCL